MRLGHVADAAGMRLVVEHDGARFDVAHLLHGGPPTLEHLIARADDFLPRLRAALDDGPHREALVEVDGWAPPVSSAAPVIAVGLNYHDHCRELGVEPPKTPMVFAKLPAAIIGPEEPIIWDEAITEHVDWEAELAVVIGSKARNVAVDQAEDVIFGYTIVNDVTARDIQDREQQWVRAKSLNTFCPLGPVVVTRDEVRDPQSLRIRSRVNGKTMQDSNTSEMIFSVADLVAFLSRSFTLYPGDVIATGTPVGVGAFRAPPVWLRDGDEVEIEIDGIGVLRNHCSVRPRA